MTISDPPSLDANNEYDNAAYTITENVYETLTYYEGQTTEKVKGVLAKAWNRSDDFKTWTFYLRDGVKFHDGTAFNASAVKYSMDRGVLINYVDGPFAAVLTPFFKGGPEWMASNQTQADADAYVNGGAVKVINESCVQFNLNTPFPEFEKITAFFAMAIVSPSFEISKGGYKINDYGNSSVYKENMCGTGPFKFVSWAHEDRITLERFADYWGTKANAERVIIKTVPDLSTRMLSIEKGEADISAENIANYPQIRNLTNGKAFVNNDSLSIDFFGYYQGKWPFSNKDVRQAFTEAFDFVTYRSNVLNGYGAIPRGCIPKSIVGYSEDVPELKYDAAHAKQLLQAAGFSKNNATTINLVYNKGNTRRQAACLMVKDAIEKMDVGITINVQEIAWGTFLDKQRKGEIDMFAIGWLADYPTADDFLGPFLVSDIYYARQCAYKNATIDDLYYNQYFTAPTAAERQEIINNIQKGALNDYAFNFYYQPPNVYAYNKAITNFEQNWNVLDGMCQFAYITKQT